MKVSIPVVITITLVFFPVMLSGCPGSVLPLMGLGLAAKRSSVMIFRMKCLDPSFQVAKSAPSNFASDSEACLTVDCGPQRRAPISTVHFATA